MKIFIKFNLKIAMTSLLFFAQFVFGAMNPPPRSTYENDPTVKEVVKTANLNMDEFETLVKFYSLSISQTIQPYLVYHWFSSQGRNEIWKSDLSAFSSAGWHRFVNGANKHWKTFCPKTGLNVEVNGYTVNDCEYFEDNYGKYGMAGSGLYAAIDPNYTRSYGGAGDGWVLMQIQIPKKFRIIDADDLNNNYAAEFYSQVSKLDSQAKAILQRMPNFNTKIYYTMDPSKGVVVRKILKDILKVDALIYGYGSSILNYVVSSYANKAFVFLSSDRMSPADIKVFNSKTTDATQDRSVISKVSFSLGRSYGTLWQDFKKEDYKEDKEFFKNWINENAFGGQGKKPLEDVEIQSYDLQ